MVGCTRQSSFGAASFREAFRMNSSTTSVDAMQEDQRILQHSFVNALEINTLRLVRNGSSELHVSSSVDYSIQRGECSSSVEPERIADGDGVSQKDEDDSAVPVLICNKGKAKCLQSDGYPRPSLKSESTPDGTFASRTDESLGDLSFRPLQLGSGINHSQGLQHGDGSRESLTSVPSGQLRGETTGKAFHCGIHARDYSACMPLHLIRSLPLDPHEAMMNAVKEALEKNRSTFALPLAPPAIEAGEVTASSTSASSWNSGLSVCIAGNSGNRTDNNNGELLHCQGVKPDHGPIRQEDGGRVRQKPASEQCEGRKRDLPEQNVAGERIVRQRTPVESKSNAVQEDPGFFCGGCFTVSFLEKFAANVEDKNLIGYNGKNARVGGFAVKPEDLKRPMDEEEDRRPSDDANAERLLAEWDSRKVFVTRKNSGYGKEDLDPPRCVFRTAYLDQASERFARRCKVQAAETGDNPLDVLGPDVMLKVLSLLDALSLARCGVLSKDWKALAHLDSLWVSQCDKLWEGKLHLPCVALQNGLPKVVAYSRSVQDSKRTQITSEDLCDHIWEFRFKSAAPAYWLNLDPAQRGEAPMQRFFHMDGSQTAAPGDEVWGGHECFYSIVDDEDTDGNVEHFVQINHWPCMSVSRTRDWGWALNNRVHDYKSIPDAWKQGGTGPVLPVQ